MSDNSTNFHVPAGVRVHAHPESRPVADSGLRYLSRPPMWEPPAQPTYPQMIFAGPAPARAPARALADAPPLEPAPAPPVTRDPMSASAVEIRRMVEGLLRLTLEVVDRRRRPEQLKELATQSVIDALAALAVSAPPGRELGSATLRKIRIVSSGASAAEICASYTRGPRVFAIAGRVERRRDLWVATTLLLA